MLTNINPNYDMYHTICQDSQGHHRRFLFTKTNLINRAAKTVNKKIKKT